MFFLLFGRISKVKLKLTRTSITISMKMAKKSWGPWKVQMKQPCYKDVWITWISSGVNFGKSLSTLGRQKLGWVGGDPDVNKDDKILLIFLAQVANVSYVYVNHPISEWFILFWINESFICLEWKWYLRVQVRLKWDCFITTGEMHIKTLE